MNVIIVADFLSEFQSTILYLWWFTYGDTIWLCTWWIFNQAIVRFPQDEGLLYVVVVNFIIVELIFASNIFVW